METSIVRYVRKHGMDLSVPYEMDEIYRLKEEIASQRREINQLKYANNSIILFGAGGGLAKRIESLRNSIKIEAIVDNDSAKWGLSYGGIICESPDKIMEVDNPLVLVSVAEKRVFNEIKEQLAMLGIYAVLRLSEWIDI